MVKDVAFEKSIIDVLERYFDLPKPLAIAENLITSFSNLLIRYKLPKYMPNPPIFCHVLLFSTSFLIYYYLYQCL